MLEAQGDLPAIASGLSQRLSPSAEALAARSGQHPVAT